MKIPRPNVQYKYGKQDLFAVIIALKYLLSKNDFANLIDDIHTALEKLLVDTKQLQRSQMYRYMGFPANWMEIKDAPFSNVD